MAQILRYWECRVNPTGSLTWTYNGLVSSANFGATSYRWLDMNDNIGDEHNAQLIYHAGVSCLTKYKSDGSTSTPGKARDGFVDYWGMDNDADVKWRMWHLNNWKGMLIAELQNGRPILYSAGGAEIGDDWVYGHSWVIDGVTVDHNYFWCNWGWYGDYNGWYELGDFKPEDDNYNQMESAIFDVYPVQPAGVATPELANQTYTYSPSGYDLTIPDAFGATSYEWITNNGTISGSGTAVTLHTDCSATVQVRAYNEICNIYSPYKSATITIDYGPISGPSVVCSSGATFTINNLPTVNSIVWQCGDNLTVSSGQNTSTATISATGSWSSWVSASLVTSCGSITLPQYDVWAGNPSAPATIPDGSTIYETNRYSTFTFRISNTGAPGSSTTTGSWSAPGSVEVDP